MKRYNIPTLEILLTIGQLDQIAAASKIKHPASISKEYLLTDEQLQILNDIVDTTITNILYYNFKIVSEYQSKKSYSYYIRFKPVDKNNEPLPDFKIVFKLANHPIKGRNTKQPERSTFIKSFIVNDEVYTNPIEFISKIQKVCESISEGDYSVLLGG